VYINEIKIFEFDINSAVTKVIDKCAKFDSCFEPPDCISATSAHGIVESFLNSKFKLVLSNFFLVLPDGVPLVWYGKLMGFSKISRNYGPELFYSVVKHTASMKVNHFFYGGLPGVALDLKSVVETELGNGNVVGCYSPPFRKLLDWELDRFISEIHSKKVDILWIGISTPKQEVLAYEFSKILKVKLIITVGAAFDYHTKRIKIPPQWVQKVALEWLYRLFNHPKRLFLRYFKVVPIFIYLFLYEFVKNKLKSKLKYVS